MLSDRTQLISASKTSAMRNLAARLRTEGKHIVNFAAGELDEGLSPIVKLAAVQAIMGDVNKYTETLGLPALRAAIDALLGSAR